MCLRQQGLLAPTSKAFTCTGMWAPRSLTANRHALSSTPVPPSPMPVQRIMSRGSPKLSDAAQQNQTRWACYQAATLLRRYPAEYEALQAAMARGASVVDCIRAIESA